VSAAYEIDRMAEQPEMVQVLLSPSRDGYGEKKYDPIFAAAARHDLPVALHPSANALPTLGYPSYLIEWRTLAATQHAQGQLVSILMHGVFAKYPNLRLVLVEGGFSWLPHMMWRLDLNYRSFRAEVPWLKRMPTDYIRDHVRLTTQPIEELSRDHFLSLIDMMGSEELLLFSSDYPHMDFDNPLQALPPIPEALRRKIMFENARAWYRVGVSAS
jgi:predicted TIM-barrel fold metal-dependent hydrolase